MELAMFTVLLLSTGLMINHSLYVHNISFLDYTDKVNNFILRYPNNWEFKKEDDPITHEVVSFVPQLSPDSINRTQVGIIITKEKLSQPTTLSNYVKSHIHELNNTSNFKSVEIFQQGDALFARRTAKILVYTVVVDDRYMMKYMEIFTVENLYVYSIAYKSEIPTYDRYKSVAEKIINSFEIIP
jgi:hypothetical protein